MAGSRKAASISALIRFHGARDGTRRRFVSKVEAAATAAARKLHRRRFNSADRR